MRKCIEQGAYRKCRNPRVLSETIHKVLHVALQYTRPWNETVWPPTGTPTYECSKLYIYKYKIYTSDKHDLDVTG